MSAESTKSNPPLQTSYPISFLIVGGGVAGLAAAVALKRVGHHVLVLEREKKEKVRGSGGVRLPPNLTKILFHWGLKPVLMDKATISHTMMFLRYETEESLGEHVWDKGMLKETRGVYMLCTHDDLYDIMYDAAITHGAQVRYCANVTSIDAEAREVTLASGEKIGGDVIVGADGEFGVTRTAVLGKQVYGTPTGLAMYDSIVPSKLMGSVSDDSMSQDHAIFTAFGSGRAAISYPVHGTDTLAIQFYGPDEEDGKYGDAPSVSMMDVGKELREDYRSLLQHARKAVRVSIRDHSDLEDWMSDDGPVILIGEAAHPFPPGTIQATAMAVEDGAVLAKLFSHLSEDRQIENFLYAFQEIRQPRARAVRAREFGNIFYMTLPDCDDTRMRDDAMRQMAAQGKNVLDGMGSEVNQTWEEIRTVFGYDCEDEADDWWVQWGMLRERALERNSIDANMMSTPLLDFSSLSSTVQVTETQD